MRGAMAREVGEAAAEAGISMKATGAGALVGVSENAAGAAAQAAFFMVGCLWQGGVFTAAQGTAAQRAAHWACQTASDTATKTAVLRPRIQFHPTPFPPQAARSSFVWT